MSVSRITGSDSTQDLKRVNNACHALDCKLECMKTETVSPARQSVTLQYAHSQVRHGAGYAVGI